MRLLYVGEGEVETAIIGMLAEAPVRRLVDIGTGTGRMLELFAPAASSAIGIDRSPEMLRLARAKPGRLRAGTGGNCGQGDIYALNLPNETADTVLLHQVLHYRPAARRRPWPKRREFWRLAAACWWPISRRMSGRSCAAGMPMPAWGFPTSRWNLGSPPAALQTEAVRALEGGELTVKLWRAGKLSS